MIEEAAVGIYHILLPTLTLAGCVVGLAWQLRQMGKQNRDAFAAQVEWKTQVDGHIKTLLGWRQSHESQCSVEHEKICHSVESSAQKIQDHIDRMEADARESRKSIYDRMSTVERLQGEVMGSLKILVADREKSK